MRYSFEAIGTHWDIDIYNLPDNISSEDLLNKIQNRIEQFDSAYSRFRPDSLVTKMSKNSGSYELPADAKQLFDSYQKFYKITDGAVTPLIGNVLEQAGYDSNYSLIASEITSPLPWDEVLHYNFPILKLSQPVMLDFGAGGKGYLVDIVGELLESCGINSFCIDAGGDILQKNSDHEFLEVGLENPTDTSEAIGVAKIQNQSLCGSSGNRRKWKGFNHIINPHTKKSPENILATWVTSSTALIADGLATCLFFTDGQKLQSHFEFEYLIMYKDSSIEQSKGFNAKLFLK